MESGRYATEFAVQSSLSCRLNSLSVEAFLVAGDKIVDPETVGNFVGADARRDSFEDGVDNFDMRNYCSSLVDAACTLAGIVKEAVFGLDR